MASPSYAGVAGGSTGHGGYHSQHYQPQHYQPASLSECKADGCASRVHYDPEVGAFDYCSPSCRDNHLLPTEVERLKADIEELVEQLHATGVAHRTTKSLGMTERPGQTSKASSVDTQAKPTEKDSEFDLFCGLDESSIKCYLLQQRGWKWSQFRSIEVTLWD